MIKIERIELELWRFRAIPEHDKALGSVDHYISRIMQIAKEKDKS